MEMVQQQARDARIDALLEFLSRTDDSAEAANKARELRLLIDGEDMPPSEEDAFKSVYPHDPDVLDEIKFTQRESVKAGLVMAAGMVWAFLLLAAGVVFNPPAERFSLTGVQLSTPWLAVVWVVTIALMVSAAFGQIKVAKMNRELIRKLKRPHQ